MQSIDLSRLVQFKEFALLSEVAYPALQDALSIKEYPAGSVMVKKGGLKSTDQLFLVSGSLELRHSFENRVRLASVENDNNSALNKTITATTIVRAIEDCCLVSIKEDCIEELLSMGDHYGVIEMDTVDGEIGDGDRIDDNFEKDWQTCFIQSPLAMGLPYESILQLFSVMEDVVVTEGQTIVKARTQGDYFYLIKSGEAKVATEAAGPFRGATFLLEAGQYFGDEALVANTDRNASVTMATDGLLGRFSADMFSELIKAHLVKTQDRKAVLALDTKILDIRFPVEIDKTLAEGTRNIPISKLRKRLSEFDPEAEYLITPANDCRSQLATYLMRQAGLNAVTAAEA